MSVMTPGGIAAEAYFQSMLTLQVHAPSMHLLAATDKQHDLIKQHRPDRTEARHLSHFHAAPPHR